MNRKNLFLAGALAACTFQPAQAGLIFSQWIGPSEDNWSVASFWSPASVPDNHDDIQYAVTIDNGSIVFLNQNTTISTLSVAAGNQLTINNSRRLEVSASDRGGIINNAGVIRIDAGISNTYLQPVGGLVSLTGGGTIELSDSPNNWIYRGDAAGALLNVDNTIRGSGHLSWSSVPTPITNHALIIADQPTPLEVHPNSALFTNRGTMRAELGGTMRLTGGAYDNDQGVIEALADSTVELNGNAIITGGVLDTSDTGVIAVTGSTPRLVDLTQSGFLTINNSCTLQLEGVIHNTGTIQINANQSSTNLHLAGAVTLTGGGMIELSDSANNWIYRGDAAGALLNVDNTIRGSGHLSWSSTPTPITNQALIVADQPTRLEVHPNSALFTNRGTMRAELGGTMRLTGGAYDNDQGVIEALADSTVELNGNAIITGGVLDTSDTGVIAVIGSTPRLVNLTQSGWLRINNSRDLHIEGVIHNTGTIEIDGDQSATHLQPVGGLVSLTGGGTILMSDSANNWIYRGDAAGALLNVDNTIRGSGHLSWSSTPTPITNHALIIADQPTPLEVHPNSALFTNTGTMQAVNGGTLRLNGGEYLNVDGVIEALADSTVELNGNAIITGGVLDTSDTGVIAVTGSTPRLVDLTQSGLLTINNNRTLQLEGVIHNTGTIQINANQSSTNLHLAGAVTLTGGGTIELSDSSNNWIYRGDAAGALLNVDNTIRGSGNLGSNNVPTDILNQGTIIADGNVALAISGHSANGFRNEGFVEASGASGITSSGANFTNAGQILVNSGSSFTRVGNLTQTVGSTTVNGVLTVSSGSLLVQGGTLKGSGQVNGQVNNTGGVG